MKGGDEMKLEEFGKWAFLVGIVLSIASAFTSKQIPPATMTLCLFIAGVAVGFLNVTRKNSMNFLMGVLVLVVLGVGAISALSNISWLGIYGYLTSMFGSFLTFVGSAALVIAVRAVLDTTESPRIIRKGKKR